MSRGRPACHHGIPLAYDCPYCAEEEYVQEEMAWAFSDEPTPKPEYPNVLPPPPPQGRWENE